MIAPDLAGAVEDRQAVVGIMMHADMGFDIMMAERTWRDLQRHALVSHGVVSADDPVFLNAQDIGHIDAVGGHER